VEEMDAFYVNGGQKRGVKQKKMIIWLSYNSWSTEKYIFFFASVLLSGPQLGA
jgi:hypothetical protein